MFNFFLILKNKEYTVQWKPRGKGTIMFSGPILN